MGCKPSKTNKHGRTTYKTKAAAKRARKKGGKLYKVKGGWRISYVH